MELRSLVEDNTSLPFCIQLQKYAEVCDEQNIFPLLLYFCHRFINHNGVDISEIKSMWYGEGEKRIKQIFDTYRYHVDAKEVAPILLFNEADAIIGSRREVGNSHINQLENTIQNILLQEIENLEGILIATTNLTRNVDKAFDRRFLYKIEFDKPSLEAKESIWKMMLTSLSEEESQELAGTKDLSWGQIENIARKCTVDSILNGAMPSFKRIRYYCENGIL